MQEIIQNLYTINQQVQGKVKYFPFVFGWQTAPESKSLNKHNPAGNKYTITKK
jgi:hypothetical protein